GVTAENYILGSNTINGTAKSGIARVKLFVNGHVVRQTTVENGKYSIWASDVVTSIGDKVEIIGMDANGVERSRVTVTIEANTSSKPEKPVVIDLTVNPYKLGDGSITGTVSENVSYVTLNQGANVLKRGEVKGSNFSIWAQGIVTETPGNYTIVAHTA
ncbi:immunoglobulin-like domain-containing protein, partial [Enterococcus faecium]|uniref:immunoglobulin-like domain-containing protein n=1 Tax=Enterococcus faecium TaxID=1352 RepID=UPI000D45E8DD